MLGNPAPWNAPFQRIVWLLPVAFTLHDLEEWIWQPVWSPEGFRSPVAPFAFRFAIVAVTLAAWLIAFFAARGRPRGPAVYAAVAAAGILLLNVLFPHVLATLFFCRYAPGVVTAVGLNLWVSPLVLRAALRSGVATRRGSALATAVGCGVMLVCLPLLFWLGSLLAPA